MGDTKLFVQICLHLYGTRRRVALVIHRWSLQVFIQQIHLLKETLIITFNDKLIVILLRNICNFERAGGNGRRENGRAVTGWARMGGAGTGGAEVGRTGTDGAVIAGRNRPQSFA